MSVSLTGRIDGRTVYWPERILFSKLFLSEFHRGSKRASCRGDGTLCRTIPRDRIEGHSDSGEKNLVFYAVKRQAVRSHEDEPSQNWDAGEGARHIMPELLKLTRRRMGRVIRCGVGGISIKSYLITEDMTLIRYGRRCTPYHFVQTMQEDWRPFEYTIMTGIRGEKRWHFLNSGIFWVYPGGMEHILNSVGPFPIKAGSTAVTGNRIFHRVMSGSVQCPFDDCEFPQRYICGG